eukprot:gene14819-5932_t
MAAQDTTAESNSASQTGHTNLILGAGTLIALINDYWNMELDDLAIWEDHVLTAEEVVHALSKHEAKMVSKKTPEDKDCAVKINLLYPSQKYDDGMKLEVEKSCTGWHFDF